MKKKLLAYVYPIVILVNCCALTSCTGQPGAHGHIVSVPTRSSESVRPSFERYYDSQTQDWQFAQD